MLQHLTTALKVVTQGMIVLSPVSYRHLTKENMFILHYNLAAGFNKSHQMTKPWINVSLSVLYDFKSRLFLLKIYELQNWSNIYI